MITRSWFVVLAVVCGLLALSCGEAQAAPPRPDFRTVYRAPHTDLVSVSCVRVGECLAIDSNGGTVRLHDERWSAVATRLPAAEDMRSISCEPSGTCMATGTDHDVLYRVGPHRVRERRVDIPPVTDDTSVEYSGDSVSCLRASWCMAVGTARARTKRYAVEVSIWNGTSWRSQLVPSARPNGDLEGQQVTCWAVGECRITAFSNAAYPAIVNANILRWSHGHVAVTRPFGHRDDTTDFADISCTSAQWCLALGGLSHRGITHQHEESAVWNGKAWHLRPSTIPVQGSAPLEPTSLTCLSRGLCVATASTFETHPTTGIALWTKGTWMRQTVATPAGPGQAGLKDVTCPSVAHCVAVGTVFTRQKARAYIQTGSVTRR